MKWLLRSIIFSIVILSFSTAIAEDTVTAHIVLDFDRSQFRLVDPASQVPAGDIVKLWGWLKFETQGEIEPQTYYLEWEYKDDGQSVILGNYNTNIEYLIYERRLDRADDYYWVSKRVWVQEQGIYVFRVYIKENNEFRIITQTSISIEE